jgi:hypothetical protein
MDALFRMAAAFAFTTPGSNALSAMTSSESFVWAAFLGARPPRRPLAREARAFASLLFAPTNAATPTTLIRAFPDRRPVRRQETGRPPPVSGESRFGTEDALFEPPTSIVPADLKDPRLKLGLAQIVRIDARTESA